MPDEIMNQAEELLQNTQTDPAELLPAEFPVTETEAPEQKQTSVPQTEDTAPAAEEIPEDNVIPAAEEEAKAPVLPPVFPTYGQPYTSRQFSGSEYATPDSEKTARPSFWKRLLAGIIDLVLFGIAFRVWKGVLPQSWEETPVFFFYTASTVVEEFLRITYQTVTTYFLGGTLGKKLLKMKVVDRDSGARPSLWQVFFRESFGKYLSGILLGIGYFMIGSKKGSLHDRLADTDVIFA